MTGIAAVLPAAVGLLWAVLVLAIAWRRRPAPRRVRELAAVGPRSGRRRELGLARVVATAAATIGAPLRRAAGLPADDAAARRLGAAVALGVVAAWASPLASLPVALATWWVPPLVRRRLRRRRWTAVLDDLPDLIELLRLSLGSGRSLRLTLAEVAPRCPGTTGAALRDVVERVSFGVPLADALVELRRLGPHAEPLVDALVLGERQGAPLGALLDRLAAEARLTRRRRAEESARTVPVKLLFPLVFCTLPAFGLLTVVPLVASALDHLTS